MELRSSIAFICDQETLEVMDVLLNDDGIMDDMVSSLDYIPELETDDTNVWRCNIDSDSWINIYELQTRIDSKVESLKYDIIYASTDTKTFIDVVSLSGNFDSYLDTDVDKIQEMCETYGLEFYGVEDQDDEEYYDDEEDSQY
ncbi:hypothetical protein GNZ01_06100 [Escherichia coli]|uniref:Uncharacterized protein n=5 Tax=root TaxID=1 RepID=A0AAJ2Y2V4_ECOLX|nr:hypothetical protein [Escherichia coli]YP_009101605.1 hypothetical protein PBI_121Q_11 [Escherichia phage 121Q]AXC36745.1 hypothetical protein [Escherichia phage UB]MED6536519.1 hypothetical protein [Escherichia coli O157]QBO61784.1 hypothetical protein G17_00295 [Escherichia phage vB_EcoM_G17]QDF13828.1 hypothetical protein vBEcoMphAPEC6_gp199c [Escherichia phage vB_EcoM_phAPEC6]WIL00881.1 hypothetical protein [Escherichia phage vB_EcoM_CRJP21]WNN14611.1 hypothetical protein Sharanji_gp3